jgi:lipopolysaccharide export system protein LptA
MVQKEPPDRTLTGTGVHGEYYSGEEKVILRGSNARLVDTLKGTSEAPELIYFINDDRLLGSGAPNNPVKSRVKRTPKPPK